jgi:hypothetical protein
MQPPTSGAKLGCKCFLLHEPESEYAFAAD